MRANSPAKTLWIRLISCAIAGLFADSELVGGLLYHNYPGGTGLLSGAVLGKLAGSVGRYVQGKN